MQITDYHAKFFAHELTKRCSSDSVEKLASVLADAQVDLNPHQVEAALFAFRSPFSRGAILADEVGLGKTIEAGLLLSQKWAERKHRLLVIVPANLRKQWSQELFDKFHLPSVILENRTFNEQIRTGNLNPLHQNAVILCSYQFSWAKEPYIRQTPWDLVVIDEAHRLRIDYTQSGKHISILEPLVGKGRWISCSNFSVSALETEDNLVMVGFTEDGLSLEETQCQRLFDLPGDQRSAQQGAIPADVLARLTVDQSSCQKMLLDDMTARNARWFDIEMDKLDHWAEDRRASLKVELSELDDAIKETRKAARQAPTLPEKLERQRELRKLETRRDAAWRSYDEASRELDRQKDALAAG